MRRARLCWHSYIIGGAPLGVLFLIRHALVPDILIAERWPKVAVDLGPRANRQKLTVPRPKRVHWGTDGRPRVSFLALA